MPRPPKQRTVWVMIEHTVSAPLGEDNEIMSIGCNYCWDSAVAIIIVACIAQWGPVTLFPCCEGK